MESNTVLNVLIIEDNDLLITAYTNILSSEKSDYTIQITTAQNCETAFNILTNTKTYETFDVIFLDKRLPPFEEKNIHSGEDLAVLIREYHPESKIIILTSFASDIWLYEITEKINPEGLLFKSDFDNDLLYEAFDIIAKGGSYYSSSVKKGLEKINSQEVFLDQHNRKIFELLKKGVSPKDMVNILPLSIDSIETRIIEIKITLQNSKRE